MLLIVEDISGLALLVAGRYLGVNQNQPCAHSIAEHGYGLLDAVSDCQRFASCLCTLVLSQPCAMTTFYVASHCRVSLAGECVKLWPSLAEAITYVHRFHARKQLSCR